MRTLTNFEYVSYMRRRAHEKIHKPVQSNWLNVRKGVFWTLIHLFSSFSLYILFLIWITKFRVEFFEQDRPNICFAAKTHLSGTQYQILQDLWNSVVF
jgi:hypothetical protein